MNWARQPTPASGAATAAILWFPTEFLKARRVRAEKGKTMFHFESAPAGQAAEIRLLYSREPSEALEPSFAGKARPICHFDFPNGEHLAVVGRYVEFNSVAIDTFPKKTANYVELMKNSLPKPGSALEGLTMALYNDAATDGVLKVIEVGGVRLSADGTTTTGARRGTGS